MAINVGDVLKVVLTMTYLGEVICQNIYHVVVGSDDPGPFPDGDVIENILVWLSEIYDHIEQDVSDRVKATALAVFNITQDRNLGEQAVVNIFDGTNLGDPLPSPMAGLVTCPTTRPKSIAKKFIPGIVEASTTDGRIYPGAVGRLLLLGTTWLLGRVAAGGGHFIFPVIWREIEQAWKGLTGVNTTDIPGVLRRRKPGVGI